MTTTAEDDGRHPDLPLLLRTRKSYHLHQPKSNSTCKWVLEFYTFAFGFAFVHCEWSLSVPRTSYATESCHRFV